jgi:hypothetical protein
MSDSRRGSESDVDSDPAVAASRAVGGDDAGAAGTTGTGKNEEFVGRAAGQDEGYDEETGAEARAQAGEG